MPMSAMQIVDGVGVPVAGTWSVDPGHTEVGVAGRHLELPKTRGRFSGVDGTIHVADHPPHQRSTSPSTWRRWNPE
jgi:polyisoprenoid-binding protein YceI